MTLPTIEKGIPIPPKKGTNPISTLVRSLEIGDSILCTDPKQAANIASLASHLKMKLARRSVPEGVRIWRTA